jgi:hypothetical protein
MVNSQGLPFDTSRAAHIFKAIVPHTDSASLIHTTLTAKSTMHFPAGVRYERTSRYSIRLSVMAHTVLGQRFECRFAPARVTQSTKTDGQAWHKVDPGR